MSRVNERVGIVGYVFVLVAGSAAGAAAQRSDPVETEVVYAIPGMDRVEVLEGVRFTPEPGPALYLDAYLPPGLSADARTRWVGGLVGWCVSALVG